MRLTIKLREMVGKPLLILEIAVFLLCLVQITFSIGYILAGLIYALPFSIVTVILVRFIYISLMAPCCNLKDEYEFTPDRLTQTRKGVTMKEISMGYGLHVYRYGGILRTTLVFSRRELPQGEILKRYKKDPEVVYIPYIPGKMPKLKRYFDKATRI